MKSTSASLPVVFGDEFRRGKSYSTKRPNGSKDWLIIYTVAGGGAVGLPNGTFRTQPGDLLLYEPGIAQEYGTDPEVQHWRIQWAHFYPRPNWYPWMSWTQIGPQTRLASIPTKLRGLCFDALGRMIRASRRDDSIRTALALVALEEALLCGWAAKMTESDRPVDQRIERAISHLLDDFKSPFCLPELARKSGLSVSRFSDLFQRQTGKTSGRFVEEQRISHAANLLRLTTLAVGEVATECGFNDAFYFANRFRRYHQMSPTQFRKKGA